MKPVVIVGAARTAIGSFQGNLAAVSAVELGSVVIKEALARAKVDPNEVDQVIMGNVLSAGLGQAPARQATLGAGLPNEVEAMTINKVCGSSLASAMIGANAIRCDDAQIVVAGGMENMSRTPYLLDRAREGYRMGDGRLIDSMIKDGLWEVYNDFHMGLAAELLSEKEDINRGDQDQYAIASYQKTLEAQKRGKFKAEIVPVTIPQRRGPDLKVDEDEEPKRVKFDKITALKPAFKEKGCITAANASSINDGAAAVVLTSEERANELGGKPLARVVAQAATALAPEWFTLAPVDAIKKVVARAGLKLEDIDLFEINEAFSCVPMVAIRKLGIDPAKVNVHGGAVALGHPIGASGARVLTTLLYTLADRKGKLGLASLCIGGGEAVAMIVERV
ncbi:MAG: thiolase family protein [Thermodesulfobacteriota bacterium]